MILSSIIDDISELFGLLILKMLLGDAKSIILLELGSFILLGLG